MNILHEDSAKEMLNVVCNNKYSVNFVAEHSVW